MANTPESLVYRGREGTGEAQVFGTGGNPMAAFYRRRQEIQRNAAIKYEQDRLAKEKRDKRLWELTNVDPDKAFAPFNDQVTAAAEAHRTKIVQDLNNGANPDDPAFLMKTKQGWQEINDIAARTQYVKDVLTETKGAIEKNPYLNYEYYFPKLNDLYLDKDGKALPIVQVDTEKIRNIYTDDPGGFNDVKYTKDYMAALNDNVSSYVTQKAVNNGILTEDHETKWKGDVYTADLTTNSGVKEDANGKPIVNVTPDVINSFLNSDTARRFYEKTANEQGLDVSDLIRQRVGGLKQDLRPVFTKNDRGWMDYLLGGKLKPEELKTANRAFEHIGNISNAFIGEDGKRLSMARPAAREAIGYLKGKKLFNGIVDEVELVPGTNAPPGKIKIFDNKSYDNSPNDRLLIKVKTGTAGKTNLYDIDLTDEGGPSSLWNLLNDSGYMGKNGIPIDKAAEQLNVNPTDLYKGKEYVGANRIAEQEKVGEWLKGNETGGMVGKQYQGQPITGVSRNTSWTGKFQGGYTLTLANGKKVNIAKDDYDSLTDIYRSDAPKQAAPSKKKSTGVKWE